MGKTFTMFRERLSTKIQSLKKTRMEKFESAKAIRAYVNNVEGWEGQGEPF